MINKINIEEIRGKYSYSNEDGTCGAGDDTEQSLKLLAEKMNEMIHEANNNEKNFETLFKTVNLIIKNNNIAGKTLR